MLLVPVMLCWLTSCSPIYRCGDPVPDKKLSGSKRLKTLVLERDALCNDLAAKVKENSGLNTDLDDLNRKHNALVNQNNSLQKKYETLISENLSQADQFNKDLQAKSEELDRKESMLAEREQAMADMLTGVPNRHAYEDRLAHEYAQWKRYKTPLTLMVADIDRFKQINDTFGHKAGDKALKLIARLLKQTLRETDFMARYGGEEFVILLTQTPGQLAKGVAEKLRAAVEMAEFNNGDTRIPITLSIGFSTFRAGDGPEEVFARADAAMYRAKSAGRNQVCGEAT